MITWTETDPLVFGKTFWPNVYFYSRQREIIRSVQTNDITEVVAGNKLGELAP
jgi:hypothetical protein